MRSETRAAGGRARMVGPVTAALAALACLAALAPAAPAASRTLDAGTSSGSAQAKLPVSATLVKCVTSSDQAERSATFAGEMSAIPGSARLVMRIDVLERLPADTEFHVVSAPGLGVWRAAAPGVKSYRYLKEVTNLSAPADYRAAVRFRWLNSKGRLIKSAQVRTARCAEPVAPAEAHQAE